MKHAAIYSFAAICGRAISFLMLPFYAHILRGVGYGVIGMIDMGLMFLMNLLAYGMRGCVIRLYYEEEGNDRRRVISTGIILIGVVAGVLVLTIGLFRHPICEWLLDDRSLAPLLLMALGSFWCDLVGQAASAYLLIERRSITFSIISLIRLFVSLALNIYLIIVLDLGLVGYFLSSLLAAALCSGIQVGVAVKNCGIAFDRRIMHNQLVFLMPLIPGNLVSFVGRQVERVLVKTQLGLATVGILEMGYKFPVLLGQLISQPFMRSWNAKRIEIAEESDASEEIGRMFTYYLYLVSFGGLVMAVNIQPILEILTPPEFWPAARITRIEIVTTILTGSYYHLSFGLIWAKDTKMMSKLRGWTSVVKIGLAYLFISLWGFAGAAISACIIAAVLSALGFYFGQRRYRLQIEYAKLAGISAAVLGIYYFLSEFDLTRLRIVQYSIDHVMPGIVESVRDSFLGSWKEGKVVRVLDTRSLLIVEIFFKTAFCMPYVALFPMVNKRTRNRLHQLGRRLFFK